jgi:hypothetical protein
MKKKISLIIALTISSLAIAQVGKGTLMLGGNVGFNMAGETTNRTTNPAGVTIETRTIGNNSWNFSPTVGYFLSDRNVLGLRLNLSSTFVHRRSNGTTQENVNASGLGSELFFRHYYTITDNFFLFMEAGLGFATSSYTDREDGDEPNQLVDGNYHKSTQMMINLGPGLAFFPSEKWGIDFTLNRFVAFRTQNDRVERPNGSVTTQDRSFFSLGAGMMPSLGVHYFFNR